MQSSSIGISEKSLQILFKKWEGIIKRQESGSIINLSSRTQSYRVNQFIDANQAKEVVYITLNCASQTVASRKELRELILSHKITKKQRRVIFILNADLLLADYPDLLEELDTYALENTTNSILYFFQNNITYSWRIKEVTPFSTLLKNVFIEPLVTVKEVQYFIDKYAQWANCIISLELRKSITLCCGGRLWLASEMVREYAKNKKNVISVSPELKRKVMVVWSEFMPIEQQVLKKIIFRIRITDAEELEAYRYLRSINVITEQGSELLIRGKLLREFIKENFNTVTTGLSLIGKDIFLNGVNISPIFSFRERALLKIFLLRKNELITRDEIGTHLWNSSDFTDWAVDQAMRRIRLKLTKVGMENKVINSVRGRGYVFSGK